MSPGLWCSHQSSTCNEPQSRVEAQFGGVCVKVCISAGVYVRETERSRARKRERECSQLPPGDSDGPVPWPRRWKEAEALHY